MGIRYREALRLPKESSRRRYKSFGKHYRRHRKCSQQRSAVIKSLRTSPELAREVTLMIVRCLTVETKPATELLNRRTDFSDQNFVHFGISADWVSSRCTLKLSTRLNLTKDIRMDLSLSICSLRWKAMRYLSTGRGVRRRKAQQYPSPKAMAPMMYGRLVAR